MLRFQSLTSFERMKLEFPNRCGSAAASIDEASRPCKPPSDAYAISIHRLGSLYARLPCHPQRRACAHFDQSQRTNAAHAQRSTKHTSHVCCFLKPTCVRTLKKGKHKSSQQHTNSLVVVVGFSPCITSHHIKSVWRRGLRFESVHSHRIDPCLFTCSVCQKIGCAFQIRKKCTNIDSQERICASSRRPSTAQTQIIETGE